MSTSYGAPFGVFSDSPFGMGPSFGIMGVIVPLFFLVFFGILGAMIFKSIGQWSRNNNSPKLTVDAKVIAKRTHVWGDHSRTDYYITFEVESGDRMELEVPDNQFGFLIEGDKGKLTFQGTRYLEFERK